MHEYPLKGLVQCGNGRLYRNIMELAVNIAAQWLDKGNLFDGQKPELIRNQLRAINIFPEEGVGDARALAVASDFVLCHSLQVHHPLCIAHLHCPTTLSAQGAEVLLNVANQSMDSWNQGPAATILEQHMITWLREQIGYATGDAGVFTSGGTQSNLMGLLLARDISIAKHWGWRSREKGLPPDLHRLKVLCSEKAHFSIQQALYLLGLGADAAVCVATDESDRIQISALTNTLSQLQADNQIVFAIVATVGTTDAGAIDPISTIADCAAKHNIWLHVDAAWGGALLISRKYRSLLNGIEYADSVALDFHKHFFQPISCSAFLLRQGEHFDAMRIHADYLNPTEDDALEIPNLVSKSLQTTRRFDALKLWVSLQSLGARRYGSLIDYSIDLANEVADLLKKDPMFELVQVPQLSSILFRIRLPELDLASMDTLNRLAAHHLLANGIANLGVTRRNSLTTLKMTLLNPATQMSDILMLFNHLKHFAKQFQESLNNGTM